MLQTANTDLFSPLVPKAHNSECLPFPLQIKPLKVNSKLNWQKFYFCTLGTNGLTNVCLVTYVEGCAWPHFFYNLWLWNWMIGWRNYFFPILFCKLIYEELACAPLRQHVKKVKMTSAERRLFFFFRPWAAGCSFGLRPTFWIFWAGTTLLLVS